MKLSTLPFIGAGIIATLISVAQWGINYYDPSQLIFGLGFSGFCFLIAYLIQRDAWLEKDIQLLKEELARQDNSILNILRWNDKMGWRK